MTMRKTNVARRLPPVVRIGPFDVRVGELDAAIAKENYGQFSADDLEIRLRRDFASPSMAADTFIHEVLHAVWWVMNAHAKDSEERIVTLLSTGLTQFLRDNPAVLAWLRKSLAQKR
jgi:hypothetical protein